MTAKLIWPFLRHQVDVNHVLVAELRELHARLEGLGAADEQQRVAHMHMAGSIRQVGDQLDFVEDGLHNVEKALHILEEQYTFVVTQRENHLDNVQHHLEIRTQQLENQIDLGHRQLLARYYDGFGALQRDVGELAREIRTSLEELARATQRDLGQLANDLGQIRSSRSDHEDSVDQRIANVFARMAEVDHFLTEVKRAYPDTVKPERLVHLATGFDAIERAHATRFRGTREEIKSRVSIYLDMLSSVSDLGPVLDVGCGVGELLEILQDNDIDAYGIEISDTTAQVAVSLGLDVRVDDALHHLASLPEASLGAVTAIHVVEHLDINTLLEMIDLSLRALRPGGLLIFETPNPANVQVGANSFYLDPTHQRPIPSDLLEFFVSIRGFTDTRILPIQRLAPFELTSDADEEFAAFAQMLSTTLLGAEDYAVIARRVT
jgi:O-antigen chain-terminating methyltransferase